MRKLSGIVLWLGLSSQASAELVEIYSLDQMDDQRSFCIDIRGHKSKAKVNLGLQAHTCYSYQGSIAVDQGFGSLGLDERLDRSRQAQRATERADFDDHYRTLC